MQDHRWFRPKPDPDAPPFDSALSLVAFTDYDALAVYSGRPETLIDWSLVDLSPVARVARGMRYLRATYPDALLRINIDDVDIDDGKCCVLGQLWGDYISSPEFLTEDGDWRIAHGFLSMNDDEVEPVAWPTALTAEWRNALHEWLGERA